MVKLNSQGRVDTKLLLEAYINHLKSKDLFIEETFDYSLLELNHEVNYKKITAKNLIFAEGFRNEEKSIF